MAMELLTLDDLQDFKKEFFRELKTYLTQERKESEIANSNNQNLDEKRWLKTDEVLRILKISTTKLQVMRNKGIMPYSKIGQTLFYDIEDVNQVIATYKIRRYDVNKKRK